MFVERKSDVLALIEVAVLEEVFKNLDWEEAGIHINGEYVGRIFVAPTTSKVGEAHILSHWPLNL